MRKIFFCLIVCLFITVLGSCGKKQSVKLTITSHRDGATVNRPLPMQLRGTIENYSGMDEEEKSNLHVYLIEQSTRENIWHIEPEVIMAPDGNWKGLTWLGNWRQGRYSTFNVCVFASPEKLQLNNGDHPVKEKPAHTGETCIQIKRKK